MGRILPGTSWSFMVFGVCATIGLVALLYGLVRRRGLKPTMILFTWCTTFFMTKEFLTHHNWFNHIYYINIETIRIFTIPIVIVFGWSFAVLMSLEVGRTLMERIFPKKVPLFLTTVVSCIVVASICHLIETMGVANYWWSWPPYNIKGITNAFLVNITLNPFEAWMFFASVVILPFMLSHLTQKGPAWSHFPIYIVWAAFFFITFYGVFRQDYDINLIPTSIFVSSVLIPIRYEPRLREQHKQGRGAFIFAALLMVATILLMDLIAIFTFADQWTLLLAPLSFLLLLAIYRDILSSRQAVGVAVWFFFICMLFRRPDAAFNTFWALAFFGMIFFWQKTMKGLSRIGMTDRKLIYVGTVYNIYVLISILVVVIFRHRALGP